MPCLTQPKDVPVNTSLHGPTKCTLMCSKYNKSSQSHLGRAYHYPSRQRMHLSAACASCAMSTADKSSYLAMGMLHPHHISPLTHRSLTVTFTITLTKVDCSSQHGKVRVRVTGDITPKFPNQTM